MTDEEYERATWERMRSMNKQARLHADIWAAASVLGGLVFLGTLIFVVCSL